MTKKVYKIKRMKEARKKEKRQKKGEKEKYKKVKVKVKITLEQATKALRGSGGTAILFL